MRCDKCQKNEATIHFTPVVDGKPLKTVNLCKNCAPDLRARHVEATYRRVTPEEFARLQSDPKAAESFLTPTPEEALQKVLHELKQSAHPEKLLRQGKKQKGGDGCLFLGTDWHALHFLLTGDSDLKPHPLPAPPLGNVVLGGTETPWPCTRGHVRFLTPDEVRAVADTLTRISVEELRSRFSVASFNAAQICPHPGRARWTEEDAEAVFEIYPQVVGFFQATAHAGDMILLSLD